MHVLLVSAVAYAALLVLSLGWFHCQVTQTPGPMTITAPEPATCAATSVDLQTPQQRMAGHAQGTAAPAAPAAVASAPSIVAVDPTTEAAVIAADIAAANQACLAALWERHDQAWAEFLSAPVGSPAKAYAFHRWQERGKLAMRAEAQARHASLDSGVRP